MKAPVCYGQIHGRTWVQEWYESASRDAGKRARELRKAGYAVMVSSMGEQVTSVGRVKMTLVDIRGGSNFDLYNLPSVKTVGW